MHKVKPGVLTLLLLFFSALILAAPRLGAQGDPVAQVLARINQARTDAGLAPLALNPRLAAAAQIHADDLSRAGSNMWRLGHSGSDGSTPLDRIARAGYPAYPSRLYGGENWAGYQNVDDTMSFWLADPPHRANILRREFREIGIGVSPSPNGDLVIVTDFGAEPNVLPVFKIANGSSITLALSNEDAFPDGDGANVMGRAVQVEISTRRDFAQAISVPFTTRIPLTPEQAANGAPIFVRFHDAQGRTVISSTNPAAPPLAPVLVQPAAVAAPSSTVPNVAIAAAAPKTKTQRPTATRTRTQTPTPTRTATRTPTRPARPTRTRTQTPLPTAARTSVPQVLPTGTATRKPRRSATPTALPTIEADVTDTPTVNLDLVLPEPTETAVPVTVASAADTQPSMPVWVAGLLALVGIVTGFAFASFFRGRSRR